jgi:hypothetical protein
MLEHISRSCFRFSILSFGNFLRVVVSSFPFGLASLYSLHTMRVVSLMLMAIIHVILDVVGRLKTSSWYLLSCVWLHSRMCDSFTANKPVKLFFYLCFNSWWKWWWWKKKLKRMRRRWTSECYLKRRRVVKTNLWCLKR